MDNIKTVQAVQCLRHSEEESAAVGSDIVVGVLVVVVIVVVVVVDSTLTSKLALTIVFPWRIFNSHKPLSKADSFSSLNPTCCNPEPIYLILQSEGLGLD